MQWLRGFNLLCKGLFNRLPHGHNSFAILFILQTLNVANLLILAQINSIVLSIILSLTSMYFGILSYECHCAVIQRGVLGKQNKQPAHSSVGYTFYITFIVSV